MLSSPSTTTNILSVPQDLSEVSFPKFFLVFQVHSISFFSDSLCYFAHICSHNSNYNREGGENMKAGEEKHIEEKKMTKGEKEWGRLICHAQHMYYLIFTASLSVNYCYYVLQVWRFKFWEITGLSIILTYYMFLYGQSHHIVFVLGSPSSSHTNLHSVGSQKNRFHLTGTVLNS